MSSYGFLQHSKRGLRSDWVSLRIFLGLLFVASEVPVLLVKLASSPLAEVYELSPSLFFLTPQLGPNSSLHWFSPTTLSLVLHILTQPGSHWFFFFLSLIFSFGSLLSASVHTCLSLWYGSIGQLICQNIITPFRFLRNGPFAKQSLLWVSNGKCSKTSSAFISLSYPTNLFPWESLLGQGGQDILLPSLSTHYPFIKARFSTYPPIWFSTSLSWGGILHVIFLRYTWNRERKIDWDLRNKVLQSMLCLFLNRPAIIWVDKIRHEISLAKLPNILWMYHNFKMFIFLMFYNSF